VGVGWVAEIVSSLQLIKSMHAQHPLLSPQSNMLFKIQEDGPTSIIRWQRDQCNKYANGEQVVSLSTQICLRKRCTNVLISQS